MNTRECQAAIEDLSQALEELEQSEVPANYIVRLRSEQATPRKAALRSYHIQREEFLPSAKTMIMSIVVIIMLILLFTDMGGLLESLVTVGFLAFFFIYLLRLLNVMPPEDLAAKAEQLEERLAEVEEAHAEGEVDNAAAALEEVALPVDGEGARRDTPWAGGS